MTDSGLKEWFSGSYSCLNCRKFGPRLDLEQKMQKGINEKDSDGQILQLCME